MPQLDNDNSPAVYQKDPDIYGRNAFYPESPFQISEVSSIRGVQVIQVGVMPFQYNPVTKELVVYSDLELEVETEGGDGTIGDRRSSDLLVLSHPRMGPNPARHPPQS